MPSRGQVGKGLSLDRFLDVASVVVLLAAAYIVISPGGFANKISANQREAWTARRNWRTLVEAGVALNGTSGSGALLYFGSYSCEFCRMLHQEIFAANSSAADSVQVVYFHYPGTTSGVHAARSAICASRHQRFREMHDWLNMNWSPTRSPDWRQVAQAVGIADIDAFLECRADSSTEAVIKEHSDWARRLGVVATPTVVDPRGTTHRGLTAAKEVLLR